MLEFNYDYSEIIFSIGYRATRHGIRIGKWQARNHGSPHPGQMKYAYGAAPKLYHQAKVNFWKRIA